MTLPDTWGLDLEDLLIPFGDAGPAAARAAAAGGWLDAFLLAAGCLQVVEDRLHASEGLLDRIAAHLDGSGAAAGRLAGPVGGAATARRVVARAGRSAHRLQARRDLLLDLVGDLADAATCPGGTGPPDAPAGRALAERVAQLLGAAAPWPAVDAEACLRLPSCFRSFDQHPADVAELVARYLAAEGDDPAAPVVVAGVRTSGSYLGPLAAAELRRAGHTDVRLVTVRPGERLDSSQRAAVAGARRCLVVDDPPVSGAAVQRCIDELAAAGVPTAAVHLLLALPEGWPIPPRLEHHRRTVVGSDGWKVARNLDPCAVEAAAAELLAVGGRRLVGPLVPAPDPVGGAPGGIVRTPREHRRAAYEVAVSEPDAAEGATPLRATLLVQGVGIGLFGHHDAIVLARLGDLVPEVLGVHDGLLFQLVGLPESAPPLDAETAVGYLVERHRSLRRPVDRAAAMAGRKAAWEVAALIVGQALGRLDPALRLTAVHPLVRRVLQVDVPSVVDGRISADRWVPGVDGGLVKLDAAEGAFSNRDLWSYDPVLDVAALADELGRPAAVRAAWEEQTGGPVEPGRWLLLRLVHAWDRHRLGGLRQPAFGRSCTAALADFVGDLLLTDLGAAPPTGPWCALDVDGVLETGVLAGASAPGWAGGLALRALVAHGHRVVLATGRGADEVAHRRSAWGLPGAVAEYGAALVLGDGSIHDQRDPSAIAGVERARAWLADRDGVVVDDGHRYAIRAWRSGPGGGRGPLSADDLVGARQAARIGLDAVPGDDQTDLVPVGTSKAVGVRALLDELDPGSGGVERPLLFAAGDGPADVGLLHLAQHAVVPAHATADVRAAASAPVRGRFQAGLRDGVSDLLGHDPGGCGRCRPSVPPDAGALLAALSLREAGVAGGPVRLLRLLRASPPVHLVGGRLRYDSGHNSETPRIRQ